MLSVFSVPDTTVTLKYRPEKLPGSLKPAQLSLVLFSATSALTP